MPGLNRVEVRAFLTEEDRKKGYLSASVRLGIARTCEELKALKDIDLTEDPHLSSFPWKGYFVAETDKRLSGYPEAHVFLGGKPIEVELDEMNQQV